ncbi:MAG: hypothetical protein JJ896_07340 [Rhodothermales bacterium]|nr:hypothetical protein [Rhodothermales bacterium]
MRLACLLIAVLTASAAYTEEIVDGLRGTVRYADNVRSLYTAQEPMAPDHPAMILREWSRSGDESWQSLDSLYEQLDQVGAEPRWLRFAVMNSLVVAARECRFGSAASFSRFRDWGDSLKGPSIAAWHEYTADRCGGTPNLDLSKSIRDDDPA